VFVGFLPKKKKKRTELLHALSRETRTVLFYESPRRLLLLLEEIVLIFGDRQGVLAREMTKPFEEFQRGPLSGILDTMRQRDGIKGECTLLVSGKEENEPPSLSALRKEIASRSNSPGCRPSQLAKELAAETGLPKARIYEEILALKKA
jgi:16S rRNA (cytidine1402-2'-O)-methyltransferase